MWFGYLGEPPSTSLTDLVKANPGSKTVAGDGFGLVCLPADRGELAPLRTLDGGVFEAQIGVADAGCSAQIDPKSKTVRLLGDRFGLHSIYYATTGSSLLFASSLTLLQRCIGKPTELNLAALHGYLAFSYVPQPLTLYTGISSLPAGYTLTGSTTGYTLSAPPSWLGAGGAGTDGAPHTLEHLTSLLRHAVETRIGSETRVGVFLSGGLDSSLIAALLVECGVRPRLYTLDFGPIANGEDLACARHVANHLGCDLSVVSASAERIPGVLQQASMAFEQPFGDTAAVGLLLLSSAASREVDVIFNGEGGDQVFGGWANKPMIAAEVYSGQGYSREAAYLQTFHRFLELTNRLYTGRMREASTSIDAGSWIRNALTEGGYHSLLHQLRAANLSLKGAQNIAPRAMQAAQAFGLKLRLPFFDTQLAAWSFGLPSELLLRGSCEKHLLKQAAEQWLPKEIVWREKRGMGVPVTEWCAGPLRNTIKRVLQSRSVREDGLFEPGFIAEMLRVEDLPGEFRRRRIGEKIWTLFMFQLWREETRKP